MGSALLQVQFEFDLASACRRWRYSWTTPFCVHTYNRHALFYNFSSECYHDVGCLFVFLSVLIIISGFDAVLKVLKKY